MEAGLWELLATDAVRERVAASGLIADLEPLDDGDAADRLALHVSRVVARTVEAIPEDQRAEKGVELVRRVIGQLGQLTDLPDGEVLHALYRRLPTGEADVVPRPLIPLLDTTLLTNARGEPGLVHQLRTEIASARRIDVVMAFVRRSGLFPLMDELRRHCASGGNVRILTTTYTNSTEPRALDELVALGAEVRVSYDETVTRLHAKAWVFHRSAATTTAYVGSSNMTHSAQQTGMEWNVRLSGARNPDVVAKMTAVFDSYWVNGDFVAYDKEEFLGRTARDGDSPFLLLSPVGIELRPYQEALLERLELARQMGQHRNLLAAATGTGKTVMAAVDYVRLRRQLPRHRLLFVAHRQEILDQSRRTFAQALRDPAFGELWVGGRRPAHFEHVFASVQSLAAADLADLATDHFDIVIVDEFHHAEAPTYRRLLDHLAPVELLGLTATPERADGQDVLARFDGRIAAELRLWDAIEGGYLSPFAYYGIHDGTDLTAVPWKRGQGYDAAALTNVLTADDAWASLVLKQVMEKVTDARRMRAVGFCVGVAHARHMAARFERAGIAAVAISGETPDAERRNALRDLADGRLAIVFTVDLFNEGIDVPDVDTLLLLRPTESGTLFLQQLGRGLRRAHGKAVCTVLDFVGNHRREFRYDLKYRALLGGATRREAERAVESGFAYLPAGCSAQLDTVAQAVVLRSIRESLPSTWKARVAALRAIGDVGLGRFLDESGLDLADVCDGSLRSWTGLRVAAGLPVAAAHDGDSKLLTAVGRLAHVDDAERIGAWGRLVEGPVPPELAAFDERARRLVRMLLGSLWSGAAPGTLAEALDALWAHPQVRDELLALLSVLAERITHVGGDSGLGADIPLRLHARYTRAEILSAFNVGTAVVPHNWQSGVLHRPEADVDLFTVTLDKSDRGFSPTTRYRDYALSRDLIHWESQSTTAAASATGQRYLHHESMGSRIVLFARLDRSSRAFWCLGPATYVSHTGDRPIAITWKLHHPLPADLYTAFAAAVA
jgi:superfamily II DNA or RNA helicase/HKD family nuclease